MHTLRGEWSALSPLLEMEAMCKVDNGKCLAQLVKQRL